MRWSQAQAKKAAERIANEVAEAFGVPRPTITKHGTGHDWEFRSGDPGQAIEVWTDCGRAELSISISATFAHLYFRFDDVERAKAHPMVSGLNQHSGKWNDWLGSNQEQDMTGEMLSRWARDVMGNFHRVCEPNPDPEEVAAYRAKQAERAARWAEAMEAIHAAQPI